MRVCVCVLVAQSCLTLCNHTNCSLQGFSVHGILQARILEWIAIPSSKGSNSGLLHCRQILYLLSYRFYFPISWSLWERTALTSSWSVLTLALPRVSRRILCLLPHLFPLLHEGHLSRSCRAVVDHPLSPVFPSCHVFITSPHRSMLQGLSGPPG